MRPKTNLILVGPFGSGKSTLAALLASETNAEVLELGEIVRTEARAVGFRGPIVRFAERQFERSGDLWVVDTAVAGYDLEQGGFIVVGPRKPVELEALLQYADAVVVGVTADRPTRLARRMGQLRCGEGSSTKLTDRDQQEQQWGVMDCLEMADTIIDTGRVPLEVSLGRVRAAWPSAATPATAR